MAERSVAVVGGGWAGLAAAVEATAAGHRVSLFEMAPQFGGRARSVDSGGITLDNGQHILIGAYTETLALMRRVGVDPAAVLHRSPLRLVAPDGSGLRLPRGPAPIAFVRGVLARRGWRWHERLALLSAAARWGAGGFRADPAASVADLVGALPACLRTELIEPLCVAALNTPAQEASAQVFLRVLHDALFAGPGAADLLLPRVPLGALLPDPAAAWLAARGAVLRAGMRVTAVTRDGRGWRVDGAPFDRVIVATSAVEAARLIEPLDAAWAATVRALRYEPIVTVYARAPGLRLAEPMLLLREDERRPAQFVFDHGQLGGEAGLMAFVVSGARPWVERGLDATTEAVMRQAADALGAGGAALVPLRTLIEKRATFRCTPGLRRPPSVIADGLAAAGDYVDGPYPATLEGAVRAGRDAFRALG